MQKTITVSEDAALAVGNLYLMVVLASERARQLKKANALTPYPYTTAIREAEQDKLDIPNLVKRIQKRK